MFLYRFINFFGFFLIGVAFDGNLVARWGSGIGRFQNQLIGEIMLRGCLVIVALLLGSEVLAQDKPNLRTQVVESAGPGWNKLQEAFEQDGSWRVQWSDGVDVDVTLGRLGGKFIATDVRKLNASRIVATARPKRQAQRGAEIIKLIQHESGWSTFEKAENDAIWKRRADEPKDSNKPAQRLFLNTLWASAPFSIIGVPLTKIFADEDTSVTEFAPVEDQPGVYVIEFSMTHGVGSEIPGVSIMEGQAPFVYYPAKCKLYVDSNHDWRVIRLEFERERTNQGLVYDQMIIRYESKSEFKVSSGQGNSAEAAAVEKMKYSVSFDKQPPQEEEFELSYYPVVEPAK
jgi:hypothetical protein